MAKAELHAIRLQVLSLALRQYNTARPTRLASPSQRQAEARKRVGRITSWNKFHQFCSDPQAFVKYKQRPRCIRLHSRRKNSPIPQLPSTQSNSQSQSQSQSQISPPPLPAIRVDRSNSSLRRYNGRKGKFWRSIKLLQKCKAHLRNAPSMPTLPAIQETGREQDGEVSALQDLNQDIQSDFRSARYDHPSSRSFRASSNDHIPEQEESSLLNLTTNSKNARALGKHPPLRNQALFENLLQKLRGKVRIDALIKDCEMEERKAKKQMEKSAKAITLAKAKVEHFCEVNERLADIDTAEPGLIQYLYFQKLQEHEDMREEAKRIIQRHNNSKAHRYCKARNSLKGRSLNLK